MTTGSRSEGFLLGEPLTVEPILGPPSHRSILTDEVLPTVVETPPPPEPEPAPTPSTPRFNSQLLRRLHDAGRLVLTVAVFLVPVVFDPRTVDAFNLTKLTTLWVLTLLAGALWILGASLPGPRPAARWDSGSSRIAALSLVLLAVASIATALSSTRVLSFFGLYHRFEGLISLTVYVGFLLVVVALYRRRIDALRHLAIAAGAAAVTVGSYVVLQRLGIDLARWQQVGGSPPRFPIGSLGNAGLTGSLLGISVPFIVYLAWTASSIARRAAWTLGGVLVVVGLWLTQSRSGVLAAVVGVLALVLFTRVRIVAWGKASVVAAALLVLALAPLVAPGVVGPRAPAELTVARTGLAADAHRVHPWGAAWRMTVERPILGWGPDTFYGNHARFRSPTDARQQRLAITDKPQNIFLGWSTSTGFIGLLVYLALVGSALLLCSRGGGGLAACFGAGLVAYLVQGLYSIDVPPLALLGWLCIAGVAVAAGGGEREATEQGPAARVPRLAGWPVYAGVGVVVAGLIAFGVRPLRADHAAWAAERRATAGGSTVTMGLYEKAMALNPFEAAYKGLAAFYLERVAALDGRGPFAAQDALVRAAGLYGEAHELQPGNVYFMINAARVYERLGATFDARYFAEADRWLAQAATVDEFDPQIHEMYASLLRNWAAKADIGEREDIRRRAATQAALAQQLRPAAR